MVHIFYVICAGHFVFKTIMIHEYEQFKRFQTDSLITSAMSFSLCQKWNCIKDMR